VKQVVKIGWVRRYKVAFYERAGPGVSGHLCTSEFDEVVDYIRGAIHEAGVNHLEIWVEGRHGG